MNFREGPLKGLIIIEPKVFNDDRGFFLESFQQERYKELNIPTLVQDNISRSKQNVLRGMHYQLPHAQGKLVKVTQGAVWDVVIDIRRSSPTFGEWFGIELNDTNHYQMYIPEGFAHGFCVLSETADFYYKCTEFYNPATEKGIAWNDPHINIPWPIANPLLSPKDEVYPQLKDAQHEHLFS